MEVVYFSLDLTPEQCLSYYQGDTRFIMVRAHDGRRIRFPAANLRPFVTREGVHGVFAMRFDADRRLVDLRRVRGS